MAELKSFSRFTRIAYYFIWFTLLGAIVVATVRGQWSVLFISVVVLGFTFLPLKVERYGHYGVKIPTSFSLATVFFVYGTLYLGEVRGFYNHFWWWDVILHGGSAIGFGIIGFLILYILYKKDKIAAQPFTLAMFSFTFAVAIGAVWEIFEFSMDHFFALNMQKSGLVDTMWDLIVDCTGALIASASGFFYLKGGMRNTWFARQIEEFWRENKHIFTPGKIRKSE